MSVLSRLFTVAKELVQNRPSRRSFGGQRVVEKRELLLADFALT